MPHLTRRQFLKLSAASLSVPALMRSSALGLDGSVPANERVTMGVLGCGLHSTTWNIPLMLANREQQIVAVCDPDAEHLAKAENQVNDFYSKYVMRYLISNFIKFTKLFKFFDLILLSYFAQ